MSVDFSGLAMEHQIHRPGSGNSFGGEEAEALLCSLQEAQKQKLPLVLTAKGRFFCAGGDVKAYAKFEDKQPGLKINRRIREILDQVHSATVPTLALVQGDCYGGGVELVSCFDKVIAASHVCFGLWQRKIGLSFGWGGALRLAQRLPKKTLITLSLEAHSFSAHRACQLGLIDEEMPVHLLRRRGFDWLKSLSSLSMYPVPVIKGGLPENEVMGFEKIWMNEDHRESLKCVNKKSHG